ncbi:protein-glutamate O-methyltransferase CheR [Pseudomonas sp. dw_358]|uniref:CheR family methyltransferase n=1 Tax=Pseudomonas sp. dw_358 TaxID=2720083 RepID=UPI001BD367DA|nr:protein-glutamate O-methyltransferase CheR [Pseudomonas sp. dw_358]
MSDDSRFFAYLRDRIGLDVASVGAPMIERAVQLRCKAAVQPDLSAYWQLLQSSPAEQQALIEAVIVPETWFLRYPETFDALARLAQQRLATLKGVRGLRLLSLPCSTGEEPYSIAMSLLDAGIAPAQFKVDAVDISPLSVAKAQRAVYGRNSFRGQQLGYRDRHFQAEADGYRLNERVTAQVRFQAGNILDPALLAKEPRYDFVFCRNLLIYFDIETQQRVFEVLKNFTLADGALFIGPAEGSLLARMGMRPIGIAQSFAFVRAEPEPAPMPSPAAPVIAPPVPVRQARAARPAPNVTPRPRPVLAAPIAPQAARDTDNQALLTHIANLANGGKSLEARAACEDYLKQHAPTAQVYYWLGLLSDVAGDISAAQAFYRKALYLEPQHVEALSQLAMLLAAQGDTAGARRLQERAARSGRSGEQEPRG